MLCATRLVTPLKSIAGFSPFLHFCLKIPLPQEYFWRMEREQIARRRKISRPASHFSPPSRLAPLPTTCSYAALPGPLASNVSAEPELAEPTPILICWGLASAFLGS